MTDTHTNPATGAALPPGVETISGNDQDPQRALIAAAASMAGVMLAKSMDMLGDMTGLPAPQMPHTFSAALGDLVATGAADPEKGEAFRAGLTVEAYADVLAVQVRENFLLSVSRTRKMLEDEGVTTYEELHAKRDARAAAFEAERAAAEAEEAAETTTH